MSNYSYVVSRSNVSILLTTLSSRTNPPFVANIKDKNSARHAPAITIVNNWHTSIAHSYGRVRHNAARAASFLKPPSRRRGEIALSAQWYMSNHSYVLAQLVNLRKSAIRCKHTRLQLVHLPQKVTYSRNPRALLTIVNPIHLTRREQLALQATLRTTHAPTCHHRPLTLNRKMKKYTPTPIAAELFPNFISGTGTVRRPELFEQFCVPIKNSWLLFSWNYLRKSKNWMSFEDLECGVRRPANLHLPLKSYVGHWVINIF